jgi:hypothetical protein
MDGWGNPAILKMRPALKAGFSIFMLLRCSSSGRTQNRFVNWQKKTAKVQTFPQWKI